MLKSIYSHFLDNVSLQESLSLNCHNLKRHSGLIYYILNKTEPDKKNCQFWSSCFDKFFLFSNWIKIKEHPEKLSFKIWQHTLTSWCLSGTWFFSPLSFACCLCLWFTSVTLCFHQICLDFFLPAIVSTHYYSISYVSHSHTHTLDLSLCPGLWGGQQQQQMVEFQLSLCQVAATHTHTHQICEEGHPYHLWMSRWVPVSDYWPDSTISEQLQCLAANDLHDLIDIPSVTIHLVADWKRKAIES